LRKTQLNTFIGINKFFVLIYVKPIVLDKGNLSQTYFLL